MLADQLPQTNDDMCSCCGVTCDSAILDGLPILTSNLLDVRRDGLSAFTVDDLRGRTCGGISVWIGKVLQLVKRAGGRSASHSSNEVSEALRLRLRLSKLLPATAEGTRRARMPSAHLKLQVAHD